MADRTGSGRGDARFRGELRLAIRRARDRLKLSQEEFAKALGDFLGHPISQSQISDWERGRFEPGATILLAVAELADMSVDELRGAAPAAIVHRLERLEEEMERLAGGGPRSEDQVAGLDESVAERLASLERESDRTGGLLAQMIEVLDRAGLWHTGTGSREASPPSTAAQSGRRDR